MKPAFGEERHCGPKSAIKNKYVLDFQFACGDQTEEIHATLFFYPQDGCFLPTQREKFELQTVPIKTERAHNQKVVQALSSFYMGCDKQCFVIHWHRNPETGEFLHGGFYTKP